MKRQAIVHERLERKNKILSQQQGTEARAVENIVRQDTANFRLALKRLSEQSQPEVKIEQLKRASLLGRLAVQKSFRISQYSTGKDNPSTYQDRHVIEAHSEGWLVEPGDSAARENEAYTEAVVVSKDGRVWNGAYKAFGAEDTVGVVGEGDFVDLIVGKALEDLATYDEHPGIARLRAITQAMLDRSNQ